MAREYFAVLWRIFFAFLIATVACTGNTPEANTNDLFKAAKQGDLATIRRLKAKGVDLNQSKDGTTALLVATWQGNREMVQILLEEGANPNVTDVSHQSALFVAIVGNNWDLAKLLLERQADPNLATISGETPIFYAVRSGNLEMVRLLIDKGAKVGIKSNHGYTPLMMTDVAEMQKFLISAEENEAKK